MRRSRFSRVLSVTLSLWLALFMSASERLVECPMHGAELAGLTQAAHGSAAMSNAGHEHAAPSQSAPDHRGGSHGGHECSCPGPGCCAPALAALPGPALPLSHLVARHATAALIAIERFESEPEHLLPFATAPPGASLAPTLPLSI